MATDINKHELDTEHHLFYCKFRLCLLCQQLAQGFLDLGTFACDDGDPSCHSHAPCFCPLTKAEKRCCGLRGLSSIHDEAEVFFSSPPSASDDL